MNIIIAAHIDDIEIGMGGVLDKLASLKEETKIIILSAGRKSQSETNIVREEIFKKNISILKGLRSTNNFECFVNQMPVDLEFNIYRDQLREFLESTYKNILLKIQPDEILRVFTVYPDNHIDHKVASELTDVCVRLNSNLPKKPNLYFKYFIPSSAGFDVPKKNLFYWDFSSFALKKKIIKNYKNLFDGPSMDIKYIKLSNKNYGRFINKKFAEVFHVEYINGYFGNLFS